MKTTNELVTVAQESGLPESRVATLVSEFGPSFQEAKGLIEAGRNIKVTEESQTEEMQTAREIRLKLKNIRNDADKTRKNLKKNILLEGNAIQGMYNIIKAAIVPVEDYLMEQEKFAEIQEQQRLDEKHSERIEELSKHVEDVSVYSLKEMTDEAYNTLLVGAKKAHDEQVAAEKKSELDRIAKEKKDEEERQRVIEENKKLKAEADVRKKADAKKREADEARLEQERKDRKIKDDKIEEDKRIAKEKADAALEKERKRISELEAEKQREQDRKDAEAELERQALLVPDKDKLLAFAKVLDVLELPEIEDIEMRKVLSNAKDLVTKTTNYIRENVV